MSGVVMKAGLADGRMLGDWGCLRPKALPCAILNPTETRIQITDRGCVGDRQTKTVLWRRVR